MTSTSIRFVYFDLGNILVAFERDLAALNVARLFHAQPDEADLAFANEAMHDSGLQNDLESGRVSEADFATAIRDAFLVRTKTPAPVSDEPISDKAILTAISDMFTPIETMKGVLARVRESGTPMGILSNTCNAHWSWVQSQDYGVLEGPFDVEVVSHLAKSMKPDRVIYEVAEKHAMDFCGAKPEEILFVDDREENVLAARQFGWNAEVCWGGELAEKVLVEYNVLSECLLASENAGLSS